MDLMSKQKRKKLVIFNFLVLFAIFLGVYLAVASLLSQQSVLQLVLLRPEYGSTADYSRATISGYEKKEFSIPTQDGQKLDSWLFTKPGAQKIAIVYHGNAANIAYRLHIARPLLESGCSVLLFDYRGYGKSTGSATMKSVLDDGITAYDYVHNELKYNAQNIVLYGESIGSCVTSYVASERPCAGVIIQSGLSSIPSTAKGIFCLLSIFPDFVFAPPHCDNAALMSKVHTPLLLMHGKLDHTVPASESAKVFARANEPKTVVFFDNCGHNNMGTDQAPLFLQTIKNFVKELH